MCYTRSMVHGGTYVLALAMSIVGFAALAAQLRRPTPTGVTSGSLETIQDGGGLDTRELTGDRHGATTLLVMMGTCGGCSAHPYRPGDEERGSARVDRVVMVYEGALPKSPAKLDARRYSVVLDPKAAGHDRLNGAAPPRAFLVNAENKIERADTSDARSLLP